ncbi:recombinase [Caulobacter vibrioides]|uniref:Uncharacterized protein n=2 Tax=Caulobacter vibrioides TaxID=155892 RepID=Q9A5R0_CAUVC|nr:recombinase [Caulobacter vibrioides]YP_002517843.1 DNA integration/recombination/inversion protein [Caulobacter vibrioides NA1000]AAK24358.1 hypothetical protein CC_2387 [Caulobacter vibrioides CB15]ACL95935.1 DNA integration/recombination/inversion protein [Caulobacter vibrioides NA1000]ATC29243.1 recombinase [Caulobacter vibrioides]QXZ50754.1 recombinase [Caulobacter vibrioides]
MEETGHEESSNVRARRLKPRGLSDVGEVGFGGTVPELRGEARAQVIFGAEERTRRGPAHRQAWRHRQSVGGVIVVVMMVVWSGDLGIGVAVRVAIGRSIGGDTGVTGPVLFILTMTILAMTDVVFVLVEQSASEGVCRVTLADRMEHAVRRSDRGLDDKQPDEHGGEHPHPSSQLFVRPKDHRRPDQQLSGSSSPFSLLRAMATIRSTLRSGEQPKASNSPSSLFTSEGSGGSSRRTGWSRDLAMFNCAIDVKLRGCDLVELRVSDLATSGAVRGARQNRPAENRTPVPLESTKPSRDALAVWLKVRGRLKDDSSAIGSSRARSGTLASRSMTR